MPLLMYRRVMHLRPYPAPTPGPPPSPLTPAPTPPTPPAVHPRPTLTAGVHRPHAQRAAGLERWRRGCLRLHDRERRGRR